MKILLLGSSGLLGKNLYLSIFKKNLILIIMVYLREKEILIKPRMWNYCSNVNLIL